jgi:hypothetical protein
MDAAEDDDLGGGFGGLLGKAEGIADIIGEVLDFRDLIIMGEEDGVELSFQVKDGAGKSVPPRRGQGDASDKITLVRARDWNCLTHAAVWRVRHKAGNTLERRESRGFAASIRGGRLDKEI